MGLNTKSGLKENVALPRLNSLRSALKCKRGMDVYTTQKNDVTDLIVTYLKSSWPVDSYSISESGIFANFSKCFVNPTFKDRLP